MLSFLERYYQGYSPEPFHPIRGRTPVWKSPYEAVQVIESGKKGIKKILYLNNNTK